MSRNPRRSRTKNLPMGQEDPSESISLLFAEKMLAELIVTALAYGLDAVESQLQDLADGASLAESEFADFLDGPIQDGPKARGGSIDPERALRIQRQLIDKRLTAARLEAAANDFKLQASLSVLAQPSASLRT